MTHALVAPAIAILLGAVVAAIQQVRLSRAEAHMVVLQGALAMSAKLVDSTAAQRDKAEEQLVEERRRYEAVIHNKDEAIADADEALSQCLDPDLVRERLRRALAPAGETSAERRVRSFLAARAPTSPGRKGP